MKINVVWPLEVHKHKNSNIKQHNTETTQPQQHQNVHTMTSLPFHPQYLTACVGTYYYIIEQHFNTITHLCCLIFLHAILLLCSTLFSSCQVLLWRLLHYQPMTLLNMEAVTPFHNIWALHHISTIYEAWMLFMKLVDPIGWTLTWAS